MSSNIDLPPILIKYSMCWISLIKWLIYSYQLKLLEKSCKFNQYYNTHVWIQTLFSKKWGRLTHEIFNWNKR